MSEQELRLRIAERLREQLATWSREHPHEPLNVAIRQAAARAMKDGQATPEVPTPQTMRDAKDTWIRFHLEREVMLAEGLKPTDHELAERLGLTDRTIRRWRDDWRAGGLPTPG